jgi:hypothetical protein
MAHLETARLLFALDEEGAAVDRPDAGAEELEPS